MTITALPPITYPINKSIFPAQVDAFIPALSTFVDEANATAAAMNLNATTDSSASSVLIGTGSKTFTVSANKSFQGGMYLVIADTAAPSTNSMYCQVTSYAGTALVVNVITVLGSGTKAAWVISLTGPSGLVGMGKNKLINPNFAINQRAVTGTVVLAAGAYGHDRFKAGAGGCTYTFATAQNVTTITISVGTLMQIIDGVNLYSGTHTLSWAGTAQARIDVGAYGASGITGAAVGGTNQTIEWGVGTISKVQYEPGAVPTTFAQRLLPTEQALAEWYHFRVNGAGGITGLGSGRQASTTRSRIWVPMNRMRVTPTVLFFGTVIVDISGANPAGTIFSAFAGPASVMLDIDHAASGAAGQGCGLQIPLGAGNGISFDAEL